MGQQQGKFGGQCNGLFVASVVAELPFGGFGIEHHVKGKFGEPSLDVTRGSGTVACQNVAPVALAFHEQIFLSQLYQCVADRCIAVRVKLHGMPHDVGHLVVASVVHSFHRVENTSLHGFQSVLDVRHGTFQYHVRGIIQKPTLIHSAEVMNHRGIKAVGRDIAVRFVCRLYVFVQFFRAFQIFYIIVHSLFIIASCASWLVSMIFVKAHHCCKVSEN